MHSPWGGGSEGVVATPWPEGLTPGDVIRALSPLVTEARLERLKAVIAGRLATVTVVMDAPHDPHNGGAVLRSADAFGLGEIHIVARDEPFAFSTTVTRGTEKWVDVVVHREASEATRCLAEQGFELVATHPEGELLPEDLRNVPRLALVLGNEHDGICEELVAAATRTVRVPMRGFVESLNVSVTAAILLSAATEGRPGDLSDRAAEWLLARGLYRSVTRAGHVLSALGTPSGRGDNVPG